jgi:hypothetical protein
MSPSLHVDVAAEAPPGWDALVESCPWGTFYQAGTNLQVIRSATKANLAFLTARDGAGALAGGLALGTQEGPWGKVVNCLPYFGSYGDAVTAPGAPPEVQRVLYLTLLDHARSIDALCVTVITSPFADGDHHRLVQSAIEPTFVDDRCCQITHLPPAAGSSRQQYLEQVMGVFEGRARTAYRKAVKPGYQLRRAATAQEARAFAEIHRDNIGGKGGVFKTQAFFDTAFELSQARPDQAELAIVLDGSKVVAGTVLFYFRDTVEYHTTCLLESCRSAGPLNQIIVERMVDAGLKGMRFWNFGGTWRSQEGVYNFKKSFGAVDHPYFYFTRFLRDVESVRRRSAAEIVQAYPLSFVIPFSQLAGGNA